MTSWEEKYNELQIENEKLRQELESKSVGEMKARKMPMNRHGEEFWKDICDKINRNPDYVKHLVKKKILTMDDTNFEDWTLLMVAAKYGSYNIAQFCINSGVDINYRESTPEYGHRDATEIARSYSNYHIEQLLLFSKMNVDAGNEVRETGNLINKQNGINDNIIKELSSIGKQSKELFEKILMEVMINVITKKLSFSDDLLNLCWRIASENNKDPLKSELWKAIKDTCSGVIETSSKRDWYWLREFIQKSTIWHRSVFIITSEETDEKSEENKQESQYLYYQLLNIVNVVSNEQLNKLKADLDILANQNIGNWNKLTKWNNVDDKDEKIEVVRQDTIPDGVVSQFTIAQLSASSGATFNSPKFYDYNQYLSQLVLLAHIVDDDFHESIQNMYNINRVTHEGTITFSDGIGDGKDEIKIDGIGDGKILYKRGPVKLFQRARSKAQSDYVDQAYPNSACVLDFNRCALVFNDISTLLKSLEIFVNKVKYYQSGSIIGIERNKNGFIEYVKQTQYADIKLNVMIKGNDNNIIGEVQFLLQTMKNFKDQAHKLYKIQRLEESMETSVKQILPLLIDRDKQLYMAGARGSVSELCRVMVVDNRPYTGGISSIMQFDKYSQSILHSICQNGRTEIFLYLKSILPQELLVKYLFSPSCYNATPLELAIRYAHVDIATHSLNMKKVQENYNSKYQLFRLMYYLFPYDQCIDLIDFILKLFKISKDSLNKIARYKCAKPPIGKFKPLAHDYHRCNILTRISTWGRLPSLKKFVSIVGEENFIEILFLNDDLNQNALERAVNMQRTPLVEYMLSFDVVKAEYVKNDSLLFRLLYHMFVLSGDIEIIKYIISKLQIPVSKLQSAVIYKYPPVIGTFGPDYYQYDQYSLIGMMVKNERLEELKKLFSLIGKNAFVNGIFFRDGESDNALAHAIEKNNLDLMKLLLEIKDVKNKCVDDLAELFNIISGLNKYWNEAMVIYIVNRLDITETKLNELNAYQNIDISRILNIQKN